MSLPLPLPPVAVGTRTQLLHSVAAARSHLCAIEAEMRAGSSAAGTREVVEVPPLYVCPITQDIMDDPVSTVDGQVYERAAIAQWLTAHDIAPLTGAPLPMKILIPNVPLRGLIREWREAHPDE